MTQGNTRLIPKTIFKLYKIVKKHDFLPEAVLFDHSVHWSNHPLRPEFLESTYYLYRATKDNHYLQIAKDIVNHIEKHARVKCGINLNTMPDGRVQLIHKANEAESIESSEMGIFFMTEMLELSKQQNFQLKSSIHDEYTSMSVVLLSTRLKQQPNYIAVPA